MRDLLFARRTSKPLMRERALAPAEEALETVTLFVLALKPEGSGRHQSKGISAKVIDFIVRTMQPGWPVYAHVEIVIPPAGKPGLFATYYTPGERSGADWQHPKTYDEVSYYLRHNVGAWAAVPVHMTEAEAEEVRKAANEARGAPYSIPRYITSWYGARMLSGLLPKGGKVSGHCATIVARVVKAGKPSALKKPEGYYGPSSLIAALNQNIVTESVLNLREAVVGVPVEAVSVQPDAEAKDVARAYTIALGDNTLLHGSDADVQAMSPAHKNAVLDMLSDRVAESSSVTELQMNETILARAVLRSIL